MSVPSIFEILHIWASEADAVRFLLENEIQTSPQICDHCGGNLQTQKCLEKKKGGPVRSGPVRSGRSGVGRYRDRDEEIDTQGAPFYREGILYYVVYIYCYLHIYIYNH